MIELLSVIAIVALLSALLLPALARCKDAAKLTRCTSNLRQLGLATQMYWDDHEYETFAFRGASTNGGDIFWFGWLESWSGGNEGRRAFDASQGVLHPYLEGRGVELCPALNYFSPRFKLKAAGAAYGYGVNLHLTAPLLASVSPITRTADLGLFADAAQVNTFQAPASPEHPLLEEFYYVHALEPTAHFRHQGKANLVFLDGHVGGETAVAGSINADLPEARVGRLRPECLRVR